MDRHNFEELLKLSVQLVQWVDGVDDVETVQLHHVDWQYGLDGTDAITLHLSGLTDAEQD